MEMLTERTRRFVGPLALGMLLFAAIACGVPGSGNSEVQTVIEEPAEAADPTPTEAPAEPTPTEEPTDIPEPTATPEPTQPPVSILVVIEDFLSGNPGFTSGDEIAQNLEGLGYSVDRQNTADGFPTAGTVADYTALFWAVGDDCCDSPPPDSVAAMEAHLDNGNDLFIEGTAVATAWANSDFLSDYLCASYEGFSPTVDMVVSASSHPIATGISSDTIQFQDMSRVQPNVIGPVGSAEVVFVRGAGSAQRDNPVIIACERSNGSKVVFTAVPVQWFPEDVQSQLMQNTIDWFTTD